MCYNEVMVDIDSATAARRLGISKQWMNKLLNDGRVPGARQEIGRAWIIPEEALDSIKPKKMGRPKKITKP